MKIENLKSVIIGPPTCYLYVVCRVTEGIKSRVLFRAQPCEPYSDDNDLIRAVEDEVPVTWIIDCIGGGQMCFYQDIKTIKLWGKSFEYGKEPDRQQTIKLLQEAYPDFQVTEKSDD